jgi:hypothetical protein
MRTLRVEEVTPIPGVWLHILDFSAISLSITYLTSVVTTNRVLIIYVMYEMKGL